MQLRTIVLFTIGVSFALAVTVGAARFFTVKPVEPFSDSLDFLHLPDGFRVRLFADGLGSLSVSKPGPNNGARLMTVREGAVYVAVPQDSAIYVLRDADGDGRAEQKNVFLGGLRKPHNIDFYRDWAYIAAENKILRVQDADRNHRADVGTAQTILALPQGGHWTRTVKIIGEAMYVSIGSTCNACEEANPFRAAIHKCDLQGNQCAVFARGLRNAVDFIWHDSKIYATDNGRDLLGNNIPPDEVNSVEKGGHYGWPYCYGNNMHDNDFDKNVYIRDPCADMTPPLIELPAHVAPLGLAVYTGETFPGPWRGKLFIAYHGSWNRQPPSGYKVVAADIETGELNDFATGWLAPSDGEGLSDETVFGRPVGIVNWHGGLLVSDDTAGAVYWITYTP